MRVRPPQSKLRTRCLTGGRSPLLLRAKAELCDRNPCVKRVWRTRKNEFNFFQQRIVGAGFSRPEVSRPVYQGREDPAPTQLDTYNIYKSLLLSGQTHGLRGSENYSFSITTNATALGKSSASVK